MAVVAGALSEPHRLRLLGMLASGELCLCDLTEGVELSSSTVSNHMSILKRAGLVETRKEGRWMHFRLATDTTPEAADALAWAVSHLPDSVKTAPVCKRNACCA